MPKVLGFRDTGVAGVDCDFVAQGGTEEELFRNALEHGRTFHGIEDIPKYLQERMRKFIREEKTA
jgi:predicted small metal-binding protein